VTSNRRFVVVAILVALLLAGGISLFASSSPDGLQKVASDQGIASSEKNHALDGSPLAGYGANDSANPHLSRALAGVAGVGMTLLIGGALFLAVRRRPARGDDDREPAGRGKDG
jgi:hypothetical protein